MPLTPDERAMIERFDQQYLRGRSEIMRTIERSVCGCDYGGTSWTTRQEADRVGRMLKLGPGTQLLDVGAGSGWPALYLAQRSGCDLTLVDLPAIGVRIAAERAAAEPSGGACRAAVGNGCALPFKDKSFDAVSHADVLCCLPGKAGVLRECRRVVRGGGSMVFTVIGMPPGLPAKRAEAAVEFGPPYVEAACVYPEMLGQTGWAVEACIDLTPEFAVSARKFLDQWKANEEALTSLLGYEDFEAFITRHTGKLRVLEAGDLFRHLYAAAPAQ